jgi:hypothetical protein
VFPSCSHQQAGSQAADLDGGALVMVLQVAVPLWVQRLSKLTRAERLAAARECADVIAQNGDDVLNRSKKKGRDGDDVQRPGARPGLRVVSAGRCVARAPALRGEPAGGMI